MNKQEKDYLAKRIYDEASAAKRRFTDNHPVEWSNKDIEDRLEIAGFVLPYGRTGYLGVKLPPTEDMLRNKAAYETFCKRVDEAVSVAKDNIYIGRIEAVNVLNDFKEDLRILTNA